jgi:pyruvate/2-oxoglutarate/acetoin dehydrogenase E1 component
MKLNFGEAIREALKAELDSNQPTVLFGQDLHYNLYGYTEGLYTLFGEEKVKNTPISEASTVGTAIGASICGIRTVVDLTVANFMYMAMDQIVNIASKNAYMYNGAFKLPITIMCGEFYNCGNAAQHSDRLHSLFKSIPGLKIVAPNTPQDAYSLLRDSISDDNPVLFFADRTLFYDVQEIDLNFKRKIGHASLIKSGKDITIVAVSGCVKIVNDIIFNSKEFNLNFDFIEISTINPLDIDLIYKSIDKTGRIIIADTSNRSGSIAEHISSLIVEHKFSSLKAPIKIVAYEDTPVPFASNLEKLLMPTKDKIIKAIDFLINYEI